MSGRCWRRAPLRKPPEPVAAPTCRRDDGAPTACPAELLRADHSKWTAIWYASGASPQRRCPGSGAATQDEQADMADLVEENDRFRKRIRDLEQQLAEAQKK